MSSLSLLCAVGCAKDASQPQASDPDGGLRATASASATLSLAEASPPATDERDSIVQLDAFTSQRDQPPSRGLTRWGGAIVVDMSPPRTVDVEGGLSAPVRIEGAERVARVFTWKGRRAALCAAHNEWFIAVLDGDKQERIELPASVRDAAPANPPKGEPNVTANADKIVLFDGTNLHIYTGTWSLLPLGPRKTSSGDMGGPNQMLLHDGAMYWAYDRGEWGGALWVVDLTSGQASKAPGPDLPVRDLAVDAAGRLWAVRGLAHLSLRQGDLRVLSGGKWRVVAASEAAGPSIGWDVVQEPYDAVAFEPDGQALLLTGSRGVLRQASKWSSAIDGWPSSYLYVQDLEVQGSSWVIATYDAGVILYDTQRKTTRRVVLR